MMPVGIQMFATITSKDHARNIQQDLQNIYFTDSYRDTVIQCSDGHMVISRLLTGLLFPFLKDNLSFQLVEEATLLLPQFNKLEIEKSIYNLLGIKYQDQSQDEGLMSEWTEAIDTIIDNLEPEKITGVGRAMKMKTRSAVLHSTLTKETAVIHAANEDDKDYSEAVLVVNEVDTDEGASSDTGRKHPRPRQQTVRQLPQPMEQQQLLEPKQQIISIDSQGTMLPVKIAGGMMVPRGYMCTVCHVLFPAQDQLQDHMKTHIQKYKCQLCPAVFNKMRELTDHARAHSGHKLVVCKICDKDFTEKGLRQHTERFHKVELEASKPVKKRELKRDPKPEARKTEEEKEEVVEPSPDLEDEPAQEEKYPKNNVYFSSSDSEDDPGDWDDGKEAPVKVRKTELCVTCDKYFTKKGYKVHRHKHHPSPMERRKKAGPAREGKKVALKKMFSCMYCNKRFSHMASMKVHEKVHLGGKPHHCDMCDAKFSNKFDLFAHEKEHSALRPHKCDQCAQTFKTPESLRFHKLIHEESLPNVCRFCSKKFKNRNLLEVHERVHSGEKPFQCRDCTERFETSTKLTRHITANHLDNV